MFVRVSNLSFSYSDSVAIIHDANFQISCGWTDVVGPKGAGKTTLMRLMAGDLEPVSGSVHFDGGAGAILLRQTVEELTPEIEQFARSLDGEASRLFGELALESEEIPRWPTLSPGERKRWQVGAALWSDPAVLMLDEPTDHLDSEARYFLLAGLRRFRSIGIIVSQDRALLDALCAYTVRVDRGMARLWRGAYSEAKRSWEAAEREHVVEHERLRRQHRKLRRLLADKRRIVSEAAATASARHRMKNAHDHDATDKMTKGKAGLAAKRTSRDVTVMRAKTERAAQQLENFEFRKQKGGALFVDYVPAPQNRLLRIDAEVICAGDKPILHEVHLSVFRGDKIHLTGPNGIGKTTLLRAMVAGARTAPSRSLYLPQELGADDGAARSDAVRALNQDDRARVLTLVATLGVDHLPSWYSYLVRTLDPTTCARAGYYKHFGCIPARTLDRHQ